MSSRSNASDKTSQSQIGSSRNNTAEKGTWRTVTPRSKTGNTQKRQSDQKVDYRKNNDQYAKKKKHSTPSKSDMSKDEMEKWKDLVVGHTHKKIMEMLNDVEEKKRKHCAIIVFHEACKYDTKMDLMQELLNLKLFSVNEKNPIKNGTGLHNAAYNGCYDTVRFLLERHADIMLLNSKCGGETALQSAELGKANRPEKAESFDKCIELLKMAGLSVQIDTPLKSLDKLQRKDSTGSATSDKVDEKDEMTESKSLLNPLSPSMSPMIKRLGQMVPELKIDPVASPTSTSTPSDSKDVEITPHDKEEKEKLIIIKMIEKPSPTKTDKEPQTTPEKTPEKKTPTQSGGWKTSSGILTPTEKTKKEFKGILNKLTFEKLELFTGQIIDLSMTSSELQQQIVEMFVVHIQPLSKKGAGVEEHCQLYALLCRKLLVEWTPWFLPLLLNQMIDSFSQPVEKEDEGHKKKLNNLAMFVGHLYGLDSCPTFLVHDIMKKYLTGVHTEFGTNLVCTILRIVGRKMTERNDAKLKEYVTKLGLLQKNFGKQTEFDIEEVMKVIKKE